jgi:mono/diheme cytochrome c family protein
LYSETNQWRVTYALHFLATAGLIGLTIVARGEPNRPAAQEPAAREAAGPVSEKDVAKLYTTHCRACHGAGGRGQDLRAAVPGIPDFTSPAWQAAHTDPEIARRITEGHEPDMPAFRDKLTKDDSLALAGYLRSFAAKGSVPLVARAARVADPAPPTAEQLYRANACVNCHDKDGRGGSGRKITPEIPDFTDGKWQKDHGDDELARSILEGKGKFMTPRKDKLSKEEAKQLVALVRAFKDGKQVIPDEPKEPPKPQRDPPEAEPVPTPAALKEAGPTAEERAQTLRAGGALYRQSCLNCHGKDGKGTEVRATLPNIPDFTSAAWHKSRSNAQLSVSILEGKGTLMPPFRDQIKADQVKVLLAYVRAFGPVQDVKDKETKTSDFEEKFRRLQEEWEALKKQQDELSSKAKKP